MDLPRPEVTVTDPRQPGVFVPVEEPDPARLGRRGAALLAACALVGVTALASADVVRDRRDAVEQRRLDGVVALELTGGPAAWSSEHDGRSRTGRVTAVVRLTNRAPRPVRITSAQLGGLRAASGLTVEAGGHAGLRMERTIRCPDSGRPPPEVRQARELRLGLETPGGRRQVVLSGDGLPQGSLDDSVQRACLFPPLSETVQLTGTVVRAQEREVVVQVVVANEGRVPVRLLSLVPARGLVVQSVGGDAQGLPVVLPPRAGRFPVVRTLELRLGVVCGALLAGDLPRPFEELSAIVEDEDRTQITSVGVHASDPDQQLRQLAGRTCSSGRRAS